MAKKLLSGILACLMLLAVATSSFADNTTGLEAEVIDALTLKADSHLVLDREAGCVDMIDGIPTVAKLAANFEGTVTVKSAAGDVKSADDAVASDDVVSCGTDSLKAVIYGDVDRDGAVTVSDAIGILQQVADWEVDICGAAADVERDGDVNVADAIKVLKNIAGWSDISLGNVRMVCENKKLTAPAEDSDIELYFTTMMKAIGQSQTTGIGNYAYKISLARNEYESCQAFLVSAAAKEGLSAELSDFEHEYGGATLKGELNWEFYYDYCKFTDHKSADIEKVNYDKFPEALPKMASSFELAANKSQGIQITVKAEKDSPAGMYRATLSIKNAAGEVIKTAYVYANVWDFTLPDTPYSASLIGLEEYYLYAHSKSTDPELYVKYYEFLLEHNLSAYVLPDNINTEKGQKYMNDPRVTAFIIAGFDGGYGGIMTKSDEYIAEVYPMVQANPEWAKKGLFYMTDEPWGSGLEYVRLGYERIKRVTGVDNFRNMTPFGFSWYDRATKIDSLEYMKPYINVWCPISSAFTDFDKGHALQRKLLKYGMGTYQWGDPMAKQTFAPFVERAEQLKERGDEMWWYICIGPGFPLPNIFAAYDGAPIHDVMWQQYLYDVSGFLYYATQMHWNTVSIRRFDIGDGDGTLLYVGEAFGSEGPVASWRLVQLRDAFDEFDYLRMAEELCGREAVLEIVKKVTTEMTEFTEDPAVIEACRKEIAEMIVAAGAK